MLPGTPVVFAAAGLSWNRAYEPWRIARDAAIKAQCAARGLAVESHNGSLLWEPWDVLKNDGTPYKVFTPYYRRGCLAATPPRRPLPVPPNLVIADGDFAKAETLARRLADEYWQRRLQLEPEMLTPEVAGQACIVYRVRNFSAEKANESL
mgnify:CR=1 FL=1